MQYVLIETRVESRGSRKLDAARTIMELGGESRGVIPGKNEAIPSMVERVLIRAGQRTIGSEERKAIMAANPLKGKYEAAIDAEPGERRDRRPAATMIS